MQRGCGRHGRAGFDQSYALFDWTSEDTIHLMKAFELMTTNVISVAPEMPVRRVAQILLDHGISAVPVVDNGVPVGVVSEGDIVSRCSAGANSRGEWLARLFTSTSAQDELAKLQKTERLARDVMTAPVITTVESADAGDLSKIILTHNIKRLPVLRAGRNISRIRWRTRSSTWLSGASVAKLCSSFVRFSWRSK